MIWILLQSESPWQRNDAITFFIYLCVSLYQDFFEEIPWERFRNIFKCSFKNHKNSEITC